MASTPTRSPQTSTPSSLQPSRHRRRLCLSAESICSSRRPRPSRRVQRRASAGGSESRWTSRQPRSTSALSVWEPESGLKEQAQTRDHSRVRSNCPRRGLAVGSYCALGGPFCHNGTDGARPVHLGSAFRVDTRSRGKVSCSGRQNADLGDTFAVGGGVARGGDDQVWDSLRSAQNLQARGVSRGLWTL